MKDHTPLDPGANDDHDDRFLVEHDPQVQAEARKALPLELFSKDVFSLEADELAQKIRIKLWISHQRRTISHPKAYIKTIARTASVDMVRSHRPIVYLSSDVDEEPGLSGILVAQNQGFRDPAYEIECKEIDSDFLSKLVDAILALPPRQKQAMLYAVKDRKDDTLPLINALKACGIDIVTMDWPKEESELNLLKASLSVARKKLKWILAEFIR